VSAAGESGGKVRRTISPISEKSAQGLKCGGTSYAPGYEADKTDNLGEEEGNCDCGNLTRRGGNEDGRLDGESNSLSPEKGRDQESSYEEKDKNVSASDEVRFSLNVTR